MIKKENSSISPDKMIKQAQKTKGYLFKKSSGLLGGWDKRYFIILNGALNYYNDQALQKQKGEIKLKDIQSIIIKQNDFFIVETPKKTYQFKCPSLSDRDLWVASLNLVKQYLSDQDFSKKLIIKKAELEKQSERFQLCSINDLKIVLKIMKLNLLADQIDQSRIHQRIYCQKVGDGYYISISIKCLVYSQIDQEILAQKYIAPYSFNKIYKVYKDYRVEDVAKMSQMQSIKTLQNFVQVTFPDKKSLQIPFKNQSEAYEITKKLCRCYQVARQYYNSFKIVLKKNIDRSIYLYDNFRSIFEQQIKYKTSEHLGRFTNQSPNPVQVFLTQFKYIKKDLIQTEQACKVLSPTRQDVKSAYFRLTHQQIRVYLSKAWQSLFAQFQLKNLISFQTELYQYWLIVNPVVADSSILQGCFDLNRFFMGRAGDSIKQKIHSFKSKKIQSNRTKNQPIGNELTTVFYQWLKEINYCLTQTIQLQFIFQQYCKFYVKYFDEFFQYLYDISDKWSQILVVIGACNDLSRIRTYLKSNIGPDLCKGIFSEKKFHASCGSTILKKLNECLANLIKRAFIIVFRTIDKKLLARPFLQIDFSKICYQVLQRLQPIKSKLFQDIEYQMVVLSFDEICFFLYTTFINKNVPSLKNVKQLYLKAIQKDLTQIEQYYCNIKTELYVKNYLKQVINLKQILICPQNLIPKYSLDLHNTFGSAFAQENLATILIIRQTNQQIFRKLLEQCSKCFNKSPSSQDSQSYIETAIRSRKSTLTQSLYTIQTPQINSFDGKPTKQGYLQIKRVVKGIPNFFIRSYFKIRQNKIEQYYSASSTQILSTINLQYVDYCYLDTQGTDRCIFIVTIQSTTYYFKASNSDEAGLWIQAIYSEIKSPLFQNKSQYPQKQKKNALFKNLQSQLTTTSSNKRRTENLQEQKYFQLKRERKYEINAGQNLTKTSIPNKSPPKIKGSSGRNNYEDKKGKQKNNIQNSKKIQKQDEGTCCTSKMF